MVVTCVGNHYGIPPPWGGANDPVEKNGEGITVCKISTRKTVENYVKRKRDKKTEGMETLLRLPRKGQMKSLSVK